MEHSAQYPTVVPSICAFRWAASIATQHVRGQPHAARHVLTGALVCVVRSVLGYVTVCLILTIIKIFGATNAEIVKSMRKVRWLSGLETLAAAQGSAPVRGKHAPTWVHQPGSVNLLVPSPWPGYTQDDTHHCRLVWLLPPSQVCQVLLSFWAFPKPLTWKHLLGGLQVVLALYYLQVSTCRQGTVESVVC